jgi:hypothetical protein
MRKEEVYSIGDEEVWWCDICIVQTFTTKGQITETEQKG